MNLTFMKLFCFQFLIEEFHLRFIQWFVYLLFKQIQELMYITGTLLLPKTNQTNVMIQCVWCKPYNEIKFKNMGEVWLIERSIKYCYIINGSPSFARSPLIHKIKFFVSFFLLCKYLQIDKFATISRVNVIKSKI